MASTVIDIADQPVTLNQTNNVRVAWLFPSLARAYYWQPVFKEFVARCPQTTVFTSIWPGFAPGYENAFKVHVLSGMRYVHLRKELTDSRRGFIWAPLSIIKELEAFRPDVMFCSGFSAWTLFALLFRIFRRCRVVIYWEGCSAQSIGASRIKAFARRWMARFADAAVSNADEGTTYLRDVVGMPRKKLVSHPCQVPDLFLLCSGASELSLPQIKRPIFLYVGSINQRKGWRYLLEATRLLGDRGARDFSVLFVGSGEQDDEMRAAIREHELSEIVHQLGPIPYSSLGSFYRSADVFVSPSRADTWGVAVLEAMAFGMPVLCSKYVGAREMLTHGESGFIFDPFDVPQLAGHMLKFIQDPNLAARLGARARDKMAPYTPSRAADILVSLTA